MYPICAVNFAFTLLFTIFINFQAFAIESDHKHCTMAIRFYENQYELPKNLLHSIATVESGRWNEESQQVLPWPWTLNVAGKPYYFENKSDAVTFLKSMLAKGIEQIDIGCAQINWYYHGKKHFKTPEHAFNPLFNAAYAAFFLSQNYNKTKNWDKAVAIYHSKAEDKGRNYVLKVKNILNTHHLRSTNKRKEQTILIASIKAPKTFHKLLIDRNIG
jgi:hypothetical protein